ncbi:hypothetical protein ACLKA7_003974 [Drosophila subpalustris]
MAALGAKITALINTAKAQARPLFDEFMYYAKVELTPPTPADFQKFRKSAEEAAKSAKNVGKDFKSSGFKRLGQVTVAEAWLNTLVTIEVITWFFMGEQFTDHKFKTFRPFIKLAAPLRIPSLDMQICCWVSGIDLGYGSAAQEASKRQGVNPPALCGQPSGINQLDTRQAIA